MFDVVTVVGQAVRAVPIAANMRADRTATTAWP